MWEIRKVYVAQVNRSRAALVSESLPKVQEAIRGARLELERGVSMFQRQLMGNDELPHVETWMVAARFENGVLAETVGLARVPDFDTLEGCEIDIAPQD